MHIKSPWIAADRITASFETFEETEQNSVPNLYGASIYLISLHAVKTFSFFIFLIIVEITTKTSDIDSIKVMWNAFEKYSEGLRLANVMLSADERSGTTDSRAQRSGTG